MREVVPNPLSRTRSKGDQHNAMSRVHQARLGRGKRLANFKPLKSVTKSNPLTDMLDVKPDTTSTEARGKRPSLTTPDAKTQKATTDRSKYSVDLSPPKKGQPAFLANHPENKQRGTRSPLIAKLGQQIENAFEDQADQVEKHIELTQRASRHSLVAKLQRRRKQVPGESSARSSGTPPPQKPAKPLSNAWASFLSDAADYRAKVKYAERWKSLRSKNGMKGDDVTYPAYKALAPVAVAGGPAKGARISEAWGHYFQSAHGGGVHFGNSGSGDGVEATGKVALLLEGQAVETEFEDQTRAVDGQIERSRRNSARVLSQKLQRRASTIQLGSGGDHGGGGGGEVENVYLEAFTPRMLARTTLGRIRALAQRWLPGS